MTQKTQMRIFEWRFPTQELEKPIERQPHVVPICMPKIEAGDFVGNMGIVTGWGRLEHGEFLKRAAQIILISSSKEDCR